MFEAQSVLIIHSGLQPSYGFPKYPGKQLHDPALFCSLHMALTPQGDGVQGCGSSLITDTSKMNIYLTILLIYSSMDLSYIIVYGPC